MAACLHELDRARIESPTAEFVELALWYHDAVYEPGARDRDCEERSARLLANDAAALAIPAATARTAADLVRATAHLHGPTPRHDRATDLIVDIDLAIFGHDALRFMDFEYSVGEEFAGIPTRTFRTARGRFLASLLAAPNLYRTDDFRARYEQLARAQIAKLLDSPRYRAYR